MTWKTVITSPKKFWRLSKRFSCWTKILKTTNSSFSTALDKAFPAFSHIGRCSLAKASDYSEKNHFRPELVSPKASFVSIPGYLNSASTRLTKVIIKMPLSYLSIIQGVGKKTKCRSGVLKAFRKFVLKKTDNWKRVEKIEPTQKIIFVKRQDFDGRSIHRHVRSFPMHMHYNTLYLRPLITGWCPI